MSVETKLLALKAKRDKLKGKIEVVNAKIKALQHECRHPSTKKVNQDYLGGFDVACMICDKRLPGGSTGLG